MKAYAIGAMVGFFISISIISLVQQPGRAIVWIIVLSLCALVLSLLYRDEEE